MVITSTVFYSLTSSYIYIVHMVKQTAILNCEQNVNADDEHIRIAFRSSIIDTVSIISHK